MGNRARALGDLLQAVWAFQHHGKYETELTSALNAGFGEFDAIARYAYTLADLLRKQNAGAWEELGIDDAFLARLEALKEAAGAVNLRALNYYPPAPIAMSRPAVELARVAAIVYFGETGRRATITSATGGRTGKSKSGRALDFISEMFRIAGCDASPASCLADAENILKKLKLRLGLPTGTQGLPG